MCVSGLGFGAFIFVGSCYVNSNTSLKSICHELTWKSVQYWHHGISRGLLTAETPLSARVYLVRLTRKEEEEGKEEEKGDSQGWDCSEEALCDVWMASYCLLLSWTHAWAGFFFFFNSGQGSTLSRKAALSYFGQLLLHIDSFHILTVTGLRRTGLDSSCSKVLDSNSIYSLNVLIIRLNVYICVIKKKEALFFFRRQVHIHTHAQRQLLILGAPFGRVYFSWTLVKHFSLKMFVSASFSFPTLSLLFRTVLLYPWTTLCHTQLVCGRNWEAPSPSSASPIGEGSCDNQHN